MGSTCYSQFTTEVDNPIDLTAPVETRRIPLKPEQQAALVELRPGVFVCPGGQYDLDGDGEGDFMISDSTDSTYYQIGAFAQQTPARRQLNVLLGFAGRRARRLVRRHRP